MVPEMTADRDEATVQKGRVLVVDDSASLRGFVGTLLAEAGFTVDEAPDALTALAQLEKHEPDIILLDVEMPGISGLQMLDEISAKEHLFAVIMFTTHAESMVEALAKGADDFIGKPFKEEELLARVAAAERSVRLKRQLGLARHLAHQALSQLRDAQARLIEEKKLIAISRLAAGLAHEINNPLGFICGNLSTIGRYAEFLLELGGRFDGSGGSLVAEPMDRADVDKRRLRKIRADMHPLLTETREGLDRIAEIVKCFQIMDLGIGGMRDPRPEDLNGIVNSIVNVTIQQIPAQVQLISDSSPDLLPVRGSLGMLNIAFENMIRNAAEAVGVEGTIKISTRLEGELACCEISDSGPGIDERIRSSIFDPFVTSKKGHLGLGLTIAACFIHAHGGTISAVSATDGGTRLKISLPVTTTSAI